MHLVLKLLERPRPHILKINDIGVLILAHAVLHFLNELLLALSSSGFDLGQVDHLISL